MARYRRQKKFTELPGLFDELEIDMTGTTGTEKAGSVRLQGGSQSSDDSSAGANPLINRAELENPDKMFFLTFGSGSSGNCAYLGDSDGGFLIDAGVDCKKVTEDLNRNGVTMNKIRGIFLTHDHGDHVRYAYAFLRKFRHLKLFCTPKTLNGILRRHSISRRIKDYHHPIYKETPFKLDKFTLTAFEVSHDGTDNAGYFIEYGKLRFAIATDTGYITERADHYLRQADYVMIESNYDLEMLQNGSYPEYLKARILSNTGHLDNAVTARYLAEIYTPALKYVFLCHLSNDNNSPEIALHVVRDALERKGLSIGDGTGSITSRQADLQLVTLPRYDTSLMYVLRKDR